MTRLVIIGAGGHARVLIEVFRAMGGFEIVGVVARDAPDGLPGVPWLGDETRLEGLRRGGVEAAFVAVGDNAARARLGTMLAGFALPAAVHPTAFVSPTAMVGDGAVVMARAVLGTQARLGRLAILNTGAIAEHDVVLGEASHAAPGAVLCGAAMLGARALLGAGAAVRPGVRIGTDAVVAVGAAVVKDVPDGARVGGVPAMRLEDS